MVEPKDRNGEVTIVKPGVPVKQVEPIDSAHPGREIVQPTEAELKTELKKAYESGDFKAIATVARKIDTAVKVKEAAELAAARDIADKVSAKVASIITKALQPMLDAKELDAFDGVWYSNDFGEKAATVRLLKSAPKATRQGGGGGGKKFDVSTDDMLLRHGTKDYKDGINFSQAYEHSTDKNWRYAIRQKLLKLDGII